MSLLCTATATPLLPVPHPAIHTRGCEKMLTISCQRSRPPNIIAHQAQLETSRQPDHKNSMTSYNSDQESSAKKYINSFQIERKVVLELSADSSLPSSRIQPKPKLEFSDKDYFSNSSSRQRPIQEFNAEILKSNLFKQRKSEVEYTTTGNGFPCPHIPQTPNKEFSIEESYSLTIQGQQPPVVEFIEENSAVSLHGQLKPRVEFAVDRLMAHPSCQCDYLHSEECRPGTSCLSERTLDLQCLGTSQLCCSSLINNSYKSCRKFIGVSDYINRGFIDQKRCFKLSDNCPEDWRTKFIGKNLCLFCFNNDSSQWTKNCEFLRINGCQSSRLRHGAEDVLPMTSDVVNNASDLNHEHDCANPFSAQHLLNKSLLQYREVKTKRTINTSQQKCDHTNEYLQSHPGNKLQYTRILESAANSFESRRNNLNHSSNAKYSVTETTTKDSKSRIASLAAGGFSLLNNRIQNRKIYFLSLSKKLFEEVRRSTSVSSSFSSFFSNVLLILCMLLLLVPCSLGALDTPPRYSRDSMPNTSFTCNDKASGGYYADPEAECQMFHVCVRVSEDEINDHKFLCPNDTIFDQQNFICASWWDTDCKKSKHYYNKNDGFNDPWATASEAEETVKSDDPEVQPDLDSDLYYEYLLEYENSKKSPSSSTDDYDYQYYDSGSRYAGKRGLSLVDSNYNYKSPPLARSVSESGGSSNDVPSSKEYVISTRIGSTIRPIVSLTSQTPTTETSLPTTSTTLSSTTKQISTTQLSPVKFPYVATFDVGKPVVSVSSTSSRLEVSSPRYETSTPEYGFFSVQQPSSTRSYTTRFIPTTLRPFTTSRKSYTTTVRTTTTTKPRQIYKEIREFKAEDLELYSDSEDPFADIDWKKHPSSVTSSTRTRYETAFGVSSEERRLTPTIFPIGRRRTITPEADRIVEARNNDPQKTVSVTSSSSSRVGPSTYITATRINKEQRARNYGSITGRRRRTHSEALDPNAKPRRIYSRPSQQDFSNFRYFKTAFGNTERPRAASIRPNRSRQSTSRPFDSLFSRRSSSSRASSGRPERTASRNTRYSIYA